VLGEFGRLPLNSIYGAVRLSDLTLLILILVCFVYITIKNKKIVLPQASFAIILFIFISFISQIYALRLFGSKEILTGSLFLFRFLLYLLLYFVVFNFYQILGKDKILKGIIISSFIISIIGFFQLIYLPDIRFLSVYGWDPHINRMVSTFLDPNFLGAFLILPLILTLITIFKSKINLINALCFVIFFVAIILTFSRSAYLMLFTSLIVIGLFSLKKNYYFHFIELFYCNTSNSKSAGTYLWSIYS
jgi:O-antigen ligase